ncbi:methyltransferase domain-containing protein [Yinghuangia soli]|uniref:methyltransferase domain-containing protein n=1 Tax=Yinghuangia soli TaxID=2908204 RepID=UPI0027E27CF9|nr:methyltransferase domain-containing protein [Yinghuangia soli]
MSSCPHQVFHELVDPARALAEARRVLAPRGRIVLTGQDWDAVVVDSEDHLLTRTLIHARADLVVGPRTARRYRNLLLDTGFVDVTVTVHTTVLTDADRILVAIPMFTAAATRT